MSYEDARTLQNALYVLYHMADSKKQIAYEAYQLSKRLEEFLGKYSETEPITYGPKRTHSSQDPQPCHRKVEVIPGISCPGCGPYSGRL